MNERTRAVLAWLRRPGVVVVLAGLVAALAFPTHAAGGVGVTVAVAGIGAALANRLDRIPLAIRRPNPRIARALALLVVLAAGVLTFYNQSVPRGWTVGDYGGQRAVLEQLVPALADGHIPAWSMHVSTGESPFETYPVFSYLIVAGAAIVTGTEHRLADVLSVVAILTHIAIALGITRIICRIASAWIAATLGAILIVDLGSVSAGGVVGTIEWGLLHTAVAQAIWLVALHAAIVALERPRLGRSVLIWIATALATAAHPSALLATIATVAALGLVALLAHDVPPRRALAAAGHLVIGAALGACVWIPLGERLLEYGQHFSSVLRAPARLLEDLFSWSHPPSAFTAVIYAGYVGLLLAVWSRRAQLVLVGAGGVIALVAFVDTPYVLYDVAPSQALGRLGLDRFYAIAKPFVFAGAGYLAVVVIAHVRTTWASASPRRRAIAGGVLALALVLLARGSVWLYGDMQTRARIYSYRDADRHGQTELVAWAREQVAGITPDRYARALFELGGQHYHFHLTGETGLPTFHMGPTPDIMLRERIEDTSAESLRRFNVRWIVERDKSPTIGDPATEREVGSYRVREIAAWDGQFARIERGAGTVRTVALADELVTVELANTTAPALVALGMGYYPRWRAFDEHGQPIKVYAYPTIVGGRLHVLAAWIPPGRTTFRPDGPLPSDGSGMGIAIMAAVLACVAITIWSRRTLRYRVLRLLARARKRVHRRAKTLRVAGAAVFALAIIGWGIAATSRPVAALEVGAGLRGVATVRARKVGGEWRDCGYRRLEGRYRCGGLVSVFDTADGVLNDAQPLWPYTSSTIRIVGDAQVHGRQVDVRVELAADLEGTYWIGSIGGSLQVEIDGEPAFDTAEQRERVFTGGERTIVLSGTAPTGGLSFSFVRLDRLQPAREYLAPPPDVAPATLAP